MKENGIRNITAMKRMLCLQFLGRIFWPHATSPMRNICFDFSTVCTKMYISAMFSQTVRNEIEIISFENRVFVACVVNFPIFLR